MCTRSRLPSFFPFLQPRVRRSLPFRHYFDAASGGKFPVSGNRTLGFGWDQFYTVGGVAQRDVALVDVVGAGPFGIKEQAEDVDGSAILVQAGAADTPDLRRKGAGMRVRRV